MEYSIRTVVIIVLIVLQAACGNTQDNEQQPINVDGMDEPLVATWTILTGDGSTANGFPTMRSEYAMAYDAHQGKIIAYGGRTGFRSDFQDVNETWAYDYKTNTWANLDPSDSPPWRTSHGMVYDPVRNQVLMFGGNDFTRAFNDLWAYDYDQNTWTNLSPANPPEARQMHGLVYNPDRDVVVMFGGRKSNGGAFFYDIWELNCKTNAWRKLNPEHNPPATDHVNMTYDRSVGKVIVFTRPGTWSYDFDRNDWTNLRPGVSPNLSHSNFVYDPLHQKSILFGSEPGSRRMFTWVYDNTENSWANITPQSMPGEFTEHDGMVSLVDKNVFVQYGGCCTDNTLELRLSEVSN